MQQFLAHKERTGQHNFPVEFARVTRGVKILI